AEGACRRHPQRRRSQRRCHGGRILYCGMGSPSSPERSSCSVLLLILGGNAKGLWFDAQGMTPLTARLFASPLIGLGLGMALVSGAANWREIMIAAIGMVTIGVLATLALVLSGADF